MGTTSLRLPQRAKGSIAIFPAAVNENLAQAKATKN
nr:MAG TPA: hypothetical protein [Caudoviricetes sp.]